LTLAVKAYQVLKADETNDDLQSAVSEIVPIHSCIAPERVSVYEVTDNGEIQPLSVYNGMPSDDNFLNNLLEEANNLYAMLQEIEEEYGN
jgi:hypothetical protein